MNAGFTCTLVVAAVALGGCAFVPKTNHRLEAARLDQSAAHADEMLAKLAPAELRQASEMFVLADTAWNTLDDPAVVDHLAYVAKQRLAIARQAALKAAAEHAAHAARIQHEVILASSWTAVAADRLAGVSR